MEISSRSETAARGDRTTWGDDSSWAADNVSRLSAGSRGNLGSRQAGALGRRRQSLWRTPHGTGGHWLAEGGCDQT